MNATLITSGEGKPAWNSRGQRFVAQLSVVGGGFLITAALFSTMNPRRSMEKTEEVPSFDAREVFVVAPPPPPPTKVVSEEAEASGEPGTVAFEAERSESPVKIMATPMSLEDITRSQRPGATIRPSYGLAAPRVEKGSGVDYSRTFQSSEVDEKPVVLSRQQPRGLDATMKGVLALRVVVLVLVDQNGIPRTAKLLSSSGNPKFDQQWLETMPQWEFSPAIKKGKKVRCWVEQAVTVRTGAGNPFAN